MLEKVIQANYLPQPEIKLPNDSVLCLDEMEKMILDAGKWKNYYWYPTGETTQTIEALEAARYKVVVTDSNNCTGTDDLLITESRPEDVYIPNAFTPDDNGLNDVFEPQGKYIKAYTIQVFNRWGEEVYSGTKLWNGQNTHNRIEPGVYTYVMNVKILNREQTLKGTVTILK